MRDKGKKALVGTNQNSFSIKKDSSLKIKEKGKK